MGEGERRYKDFAMHCLAESGSVDFAVLANCGDWVDISLGELKQNFGPQHLIKIRLEENAKQRKISVSNELN